MSTESTLKIIFGGAAHRRTSGYGWRIHPTKKTKKFHYGVDYGCSKVPVYALESGTVYKKGYQAGGAGNYVYVKYPRLGVAVAYFHLSSIAVKQGQSVGKGTKIGVAGTTGASTGVHLHIGVRNLSSWKWRNPETWLANYKSPNSGSSASSSSGYRVGSTYTLKKAMKVRSGAGTESISLLQAEKERLPAQKDPQGQSLRLEHGSQCSRSKQLAVPFGSKCHLAGFVRKRAVRFMLHSDRKEI